MDASTNPSPSPSFSLHPIPVSKRNSIIIIIQLLVVIILVPVIASVLLYQLDSFDPAPLPAHELTRDSIPVPRRNAHMLRGSHNIGAGRLLGPEDLAYDSISGLIYTGCHDGWIKRVSLNDSVEDWVYTGGRPLGLAHAHPKLGQLLIIADADKGLLKVSANGVIELLTDSAEGQQFKLTDGVDIGEDGMIYFTDASHKYSFKDFAFDFLEGRPYGRFMSYDPSTQQTKVLLRDLYFPNGVAVSPDQNSVVFCETPLRRCKKYYIQGERKGSTEIFVNNLPGMPDNIRYDGEGHYWIALSTEMTEAWYLAQRYPFIRKVMGIMAKYVGRPHIEKNGGAVAVDLQGMTSEHYHDPSLSLISSAIKIGDYLYCGSIAHPYIIRLNLTQFPAISGT